MGSIRSTIVMLSFMFGGSIAAAQSAGINQELTRILVEERLNTSCLPPSFATMASCDKKQRELRDRLRQQAHTAAIQASARMTAAVESGKAASKAEVEKFLSTLELLATQEPASAKAYSEILLKLASEPVPGAADLRKQLEGMVGFPSAAAQEFVHGEVRKRLGAEVAQFLESPADFSKAEVRNRVDKALRSFVDTNLGKAGISADKLEQGWAQYQSYVKLAGAVNDLLQGNGNEGELFQSAYSAFGGTRYVQSSLAQGSMSAAGAAATLAPMLTSLAGTAMMMQQAQQNHEEVMQALKEVQAVLKEVQADVKEIRKAVERIEGSVKQMRAEMKVGFDNVYGRLDGLAEAVDAQFAAANASAQRRFEILIDRSLALEASIAGLKSDIKSLAYGGELEEYQRSYRKYIINPGLPGLAALTSSEISDALSYFDTYWSATSYGLALSGSGSQTSLETVRTDFPLFWPNGQPGIERSLGLLPQLFGLLEAQEPVLEKCTGFFDKDRYYCATSWRPARFARMPNPTEWARGASAVLETLVSTGRANDVALVQHYASRIANDGDLVLSSYARLLRVPMQLQHESREKLRFESSEPGYLELQRYHWSWRIEPLMREAISELLGPAKQGDKRTESYRELLFLSSYGRAGDTEEDCGPQPTGRCADLLGDLMTFRLITSRPAISFSLPLTNSDTAEAREWIGDESWQVESWRTGTTVEVTEYNGQLAALSGFRIQVARLVEEGSLIGYRVRAFGAGSVAPRLNQVLWDWHQDFKQRVSAIVRSRLSTDDVIKKWEGLTHIRRVMLTIQVGSALQRYKTSTFSTSARYWFEETIPELLSRFDALGLEEFWRSKPGSVGDFYFGPVGMRYRSEARRWGDTWCVGVGPEPSPWADDKVVCGVNTLTDVARAVARAKGMLAALSAN